MTIPNFKNQEDYQEFVNLFDDRWQAKFELLTELCDRIEQLEKDIELLKSYAWEV
jgi:hypothetical protein